MQGGYTTVNLGTIPAEVAALQADRVYTTKISLTSAQILNLNSTPVVFALQALGPGQMYLPVNPPVMRFNFNTTAYVGGGILQIRYTGAGFTYATLPNAFLISIASRIGGCSMTAVTGTSGTQLIAGATIEVNCSVANPTLGDGTIDIYFSYKIITP